MDTLLGYCRVHDNVRTLSYDEYCVILSLLDWGSQENPRPCLAIRSSSGTFRVPLLFSGLRRFVSLVRRAAGLRAELMYVTTGISLVSQYVDELGN